MLYKVVNANLPKLVRALLVSPHVSTLEMDWNFGTILNWAVSNNHVDIVKHILRNRRIDLKDYHYTALLLALYNDYADVMAVLLAHAAGRFAEYELESLIGKATKGNHTKIANIFKEYKNGRFN